MKKLGWSLLLAAGMGAAALGCEQPYEEEGIQEEEVYEQEGVVEPGEGEVDLLGGEEDVEEYR